MRVDRIHMAMNVIWTLLWLLFVAVLGVVASSFWTDYSFQILTIIVLLNAAATITLWRTAARRPEKLKKKFRKRLWDSEPIAPKHQPPAPLKEDAWGVDKEDLQFFSDFDDFANVVNWWLADKEYGSPWRLQELPEPRLHALALPDSPSYGRRYTVFHNQAALGEIEIGAYSSEYTSQNPRVMTHIRLDWVRALPFGTIRSFLTHIAMYTQYLPGTLEFLQENQKIDLAMLKVLWETQEISDFGMNNPGYEQIQMELKGQPKFYLDRRDCDAFQKLKSSIQR
jgi:hypothetical protein